MDKNHIQTDKADRSKSLSPRQQTSATCKTKSPKSPTEIAFNREKLNQESISNKYKNKPVTNSANLPNYSNPNYSCINNLFKLIRLSFCKKSGFNRLYFQS